MGCRLCITSSSFTWSGDYFFNAMYVLLFLYRLNMSFEAMAASFIAVLLFVWIDDYRKKKNKPDKWWLFKNEAQPVYPLLGGAGSCYTEYRWKGWVCWWLYCCTRVRRQCSSTEYLTTVTKKPRNQSKFHAQVNAQSNTFAAKFSPCQKISRLKVCWL